MRIQAQDAPRASIVRQMQEANMVKDIIYIINETVDDVQLKDILLMIIQEVQFMQTEIDRNPEVRQSDFKDLVGNLARKLECPESELWS
mgnify:FL=1